MADKNGRVVIKGRDLEKYSTLMVVAVNSTQVAQAVAPLPRHALPHRDLTLEKPLDVKKAFTEVRHSTGLLKHGVYHIEDIASTELSLLDSMQSVVHAIKDIAKINGD